MSNSNSLIPAKFLTLVAHLAITVTLLWSLKESGKDYSTGEEPKLPEIFTSHSSWFLLGLSMSLGLIVIEMFAFVTGLTMFHSTSALLSIGCHGSSCLMLSCQVFSDWQFGWYWIVLFSAVPVIKDFCIITDIVLNKKY